MATPTVCSTCDETVLPDMAPQLKSNRYWVDVGGHFISDAPNAPSYTRTDTGGCNASQIIGELGVGIEHERFGLSRSALEGVDPSRCVAGG